MTYDSLDIIPVVIFFKIAETGDFNLLSNENTDPAFLETIWNRLFEEHETRQKSTESLKMFTIQKEIAALESDLKFVLGAISCLEFSFDQELIDRLKKLRYIIRTDSTENYYEDLQFAFRASKGIQQKLKVYKDQLPKEKEAIESFEKFTIYDTMAFYTSVMGYDFDYNTVTYSKFYAVKRQVELKIKSIEKQNEQSTK